MSSARLPNIPSLRKQQLFLEFRSLKHAAPPGIYLSIANPTDPTCWSGVMFVRKGPYASAILRFNIKFPPTYPDLPPLVTFATDIFHPLIVPLTTYTFTTGSSNEAPVSATDEERLAPGAFSLRHGFPHWFGRAQRTANNSASGSRNVSGGVAPTNVVGDQGFEDNNVPDNKNNKTEGDIAASDKINQGGEPSSSVQDSNSNQDTAIRISQVPAAILNNEKDKSVHVITLLDYVRSTFDDERVLDSLPLDAAGNPGAWHAWRAHRRSGKESGSATPNRRGAPHARLPGEWNWEGVWIKRVQNGIQASQSDAALYASGASRSEAEPIRFLNLDPSAMSQVKEKLFAGLETKSS